MTSKFKWIGLTGGIATGKSTVTRMLRELGISVVDADELARSVVRKGTPGFQDVVSTFGASVVAADGDLDRKALGARVFSDASERAKLEAIVHPRVRTEQRRMRTELSQSGASIAFYDVPLLFEKDLESDFDATVAIVCSEAVQLSRLVVRDNLTAEEAKERIASQLPLSEKRRRATHVIENNGSIDELRAAVRALVARLSKA